MGLGSLRMWWLLLLCLPIMAWAGDAAVRVVELPGPPPLSAGQNVAPMAGHGTVASRVWLGAPGKQPLWYAVSLTHDWRRDSPPLLVIEGNVLDHIRVYAPPGYRAQTDSVFDRLLDPTFSHHAVVYRLPPALRSGQPIYLEFGVPRQKTPVQVRISDEASYRAADLQYVRTSTFLTSLQVAMVLVIVCFLLVLRDRMFLYFVIYAGALVIFDLARSGELYALPFAGALGQFGNRTSLSMAALAAAFLDWFALEFAGLRNYAPRLAAWLAALRWPFLAVAVIVWLPWLIPSLWPARVLDLLLIPNTVLMLASVWLAWRRGNRQAGFFLLSWLPLMTLTAARVVQIFTKGSLPGWLEYGFSGSMAWAAIIITVGLADRMLEARQERDHATHLAQFDPLTGVLNRRSMMERLHELWGSPGAAVEPLAVMFLDVDHFKQINDSRGHAAGDACLAAMTRAVRAELGEADFIARYGGEEFVMVLRGDSARTAVQLAEHVVARVAAMRVPAGGHSIALTVSIGVATRDSETASPEALVEMADAAQYQAKADGRNRVVVYRPDLPMGAFAR